MIFNENKWATRVACIVVLCLSMTIGTRAEADTTRAKANKSDTTSLLMDQETFNQYMNSNRRGDFMIYVGDCFFYGHHVKQNYKAALHWYKEGIEANGYPSAQHMFNMAIASQKTGDTQQAISYYWETASGLWHDVSLPFPKAWFIIYLAFLVLVHELGHYYFARRFGIRVGRVCVFFSPAFHLFSTEDKWVRNLRRRIWGERYEGPGHTQFVLGWLPLGGYVMPEIVQDPITGQLSCPTMDAQPASHRFFFAAGGIMVNLLVVILAGVAKLVVLSTTTDCLTATTILSDIQYYSLVLAIFNVLPIPPLDGGKMWMELYEWIFKKPVNKRFSSILTTIGSILLILYMLFDWGWTIIDWIKELLGF